MSRCLSCGSLKTVDGPCPGCLVELGLAEPRVRWVSVGVIAGVLGSVLAGLALVSAATVFIATLETGEAAEPERISAPVVVRVPPVEPDVVWDRSEVDATLEANRLRLERLEHSAQAQRESIRQAEMAFEARSQALDAARAEAEAYEAAHHMATERRAAAEAERRAAESERAAGYARVKALQHEELARAQAAAAAQEAARMRQEVAAASAMEHKRAEEEYRAAEESARAARKERALQAAQSAEAAAEAARRAREAALELWLGRGRRRERRRWLLRPERERPGRGNRAGHALTPAVAQRNGQGGGVGWDTR